MSQSKSLHMMRENFSLKIRRNHLETTFKQKRQPQSTIISNSQLYLNVMEQYDKIGLIDLFSQINLNFKEPIEEMIQNDLAAQVVKHMEIKGLNESWELFEEQLQYIVVVTKLDMEHLYPYLTKHNMLYHLTTFFISLSQELLGKKKLFVQDWPENSLQKIDETKLSQTFNLLVQILLQASSDRYAREYMLKQKEFVDAICQVFHNQKDDYFLQFTSSLLQDINTQNNYCKSNAAVFIAPIFSALQCRNIQELNYSLDILLNLMLVEEYKQDISTFFRNGGCIHLMKILQVGLNDLTCLKITSKIAYWSSSNIDYMFKYKLLQLLKIKLASNSNQIQFECLQILEICFSGETQFYDAAFRHVDITCEVINLLESEDEQVSVQACFTLCAYFKNANLQQLQQLCFSRVQKRMIQFLQMENEYLNSQILGAMMAILHLESWQENHCHSISNDEIEDIETMQSGLANSVFSYL